jgi:hypothetical protein
MASEFGAREMRSSEEWTAEIIAFSFVLILFTIMFNHLVFRLANGTEEFCALLNNARDNVYIPGVIEIQANGNLLAGIHIGALASNHFICIGFRMC